MPQSYSLILTLTGLMLVGLATADCSEQPRQQLSPEELELSGALMFVLEGVENNGIAKYRFGPWKRQVVGRDIEYVSMGNNSVHSSDEEWNAKTRDSKFIKYTHKISPQDRCVFRRSSVQAWSKGDRKEDFTALVEGGDWVDPNSFETIYLMNAYRFDITWDADSYPEGDVALEGPGVVCKDNECGNEWGLLFHPDDVIGSKEIPVSVVRRRKALELVKKACPGKPY
jgi:hypothetical protein